MLKLFVVVKHKVRIQETCSSINDVIVTFLIKFDTFFFVFFQNQSHVAMGKTNEFHVLNHPIMVDSIKSVSFELLVFILDVTLVSLGFKFMNSISLDFTIDGTDDDFVLQYNIRVAVVIEYNIVLLISDVKRCIFNIMSHIPNTEQMIFLTVFYVNDNLLSSFTTVAANDDFVQLLTLF